MIFCAVLVKTNIYQPQQHPQRRFWRSQKSPSNNTLPSVVNREERKTSMLQQASNLQPPAIMSTQCQPARSTKPAAHKLQIIAHQEAVRHRSHRFARSRQTLLLLRDTLLGYGGRRTTVLLVGRLMAVGAAGGIGPSFACRVRRNVSRDSGRCALGGVRLPGHLLFTRETKCKPRKHSRQARTSFGSRRLPAGFRLLPWQRAASLDGVTVMGIYFIIVTAPTMANLYSF